MSGLSDYVQDDLFAEPQERAPSAAGGLGVLEAADALTYGTGTGDELLARPATGHPTHLPDAGRPPPRPARGRGVRGAPSSPLPARSWRPGQDVSHREHGAGWVWGSGRGLVTVRFEGP